MCGWPGSSRTSRLSATRTTSSCTARPSRKRRCCATRSSRGWRSAGLSSTCTRPASCTARMTIGAAHMSTTSFDFLGYTFRPRLSKNRFGKHFLNFSPAVSNDAKTAMRREMRRWRLHLRPDKTLTDLARMFNIVLQGWLGRRRGAVSALRLMVSSPPPAEPDMPIPEHPALHRTVRWSMFDAVRQRRSPAGWWPGLFRGPPTARGCGVRGSGSPGPRRASEAVCLRGWSSRVPSTVA